MKNNYAFLLSDIQRRIDHNSLKISVSAEKFMEYVQLIATDYPFDKEDIPVCIVEDSIKNHFMTMPTFEEVNKYLVKHGYADEVCIPKDEREKASFEEEYADQVMTWMIDDEDFKGDFDALAIKENARLIGEYAARLNKMNYEEYKGSSTDSFKEEIENRIEEGEIDGMMSADEIIYHAEALAKESTKESEITIENLHAYIASNYMDEITIDHINAYLEDNKYFDDMARSMYDFDEYFCTWSPSSLVSMVGEDFSYSDDVFFFDGYGHIQSTTESEFINRWADGCIAWMIDEGELDDFVDAQEILDCEGIIVEYANKINALG